MKLTEFAKNLYTALENDLTTLNKVPDLLQRSKDSSIIIQRAIIKLKEFIKDYRFISNAEEIFFFKNTKPKIFSQLFFYQNLFKIESGKPIGTAQIVINFYEDEIAHINHYFNRNKEFFIYYKLQASSLDEIYFLRNEPDSRLVLAFDEYETDLDFTTFFDIKVAKFIAFEKILEFIIGELNKSAKSSLVIESNPITNKGSLRWTSSKVSLVELLYALQSTGSCNNGTIDVKNLASHLEHLFNIDLGNYYRVFQEMRIRKINRTSFLDQLKARLIQRMDETDENPKFK